MALISNTPSLRLRIENALGAWAHQVARARWFVVVGSILLTVLLATFIPKMEVKVAPEDFLFDDDPVRLSYDAFKAEFGQDHAAILSVKPPKLFDFAFLEKLAAFHRDLEDEVPFLEEVTSLVNVRSTYGRDEELVVEDLLDEMPETEADLVALRERVQSQPFYKKAGIVSADGRATGVRVEVAVWGETASDDGDELGGFEDNLAPPQDSESNGKRAFLSSAENRRVVNAIERVIERHHAPDFPIQAAGGPLLVWELNKAMGRDVPLFFGGGLAAIGLLLIVLFRRVSPVFLCFMTVVPATIATFGLSAAVGLPFAITSQIIPSFLLAIGVSYSVHLMTIFLHDLGDGRDRTASLEHAMRHSGLPILMTGLTTTAGVLSFLVAEMKPIQDLGLTASVGVAMMLLYSLTLLPALMALLPIAGRPGKEEKAVDRLLGALAARSARHPWSIVAVTGLLVLGGVLAMPRLQFSSDPLSWFPQDSSFRKASDAVGENFGGTATFEIVVDTGREDGVKDSEVMAHLAQIENLVERFKDSGADLTHTVSIVDITRETHRALHGNDPAFYVVPQDQRLLAQELLLFENSGSDDLEEIVDSPFRRTRYTLRTKWTDGVKTAPFMRAFEPELEEVLGDVAEFEVTGISRVMARTVDATYESMIKSYGLALLLITPLMILLIGSLRSGLVSMVPNLVPLILTLGLMGVLHIPIDMFTLLSGCIAIGLAVDDSIHFISGFRRYLAQGHAPVVAVEKTMQTTGRALLFTSVVLTSGFAVLTLSGMLNMWNIGVITSFAIATAFVLDVTVTPALLVLTHRKEEALAAK